jgi:hypothetical protein
MIQLYMNGEDDSLRSFLEDRLHHVPGDQPSALSLHLYTMHQHRWRLRKLRTFRTCLFCLLRTPEKMLACGHSLCDICIRSVGRQSLEAQLGIVVKRCPLCGDAHDKAPFYLMPATAGIRALCVDGGGIKGIIPLITLQHIWGKLADYGAPLSDYFDFVCGTSAGTLFCDSVKVPLNSQSQAASLPWAYFSWVGLSRNASQRLSNWQRIPSSPEDRAFVSSTWSHHTYGTANSAPPRSNEPLRHALGRMSLCSTRWSTTPKLRSLQ